MKTIETKLYHIKGEPTEREAGWSTSDNYIEADVYYTKGGYSYFTYKNTPRGYFMSASKIGRYIVDKIVMESRTLGGEGYKEMIKEVARQTAKAESEAIEYFNANIDEFVRKAFPGLELEEV